MTYIPLQVTLNSALLAEAIWTFLLAFLVLNEAVADSNKRNSFYGFAIGGIVLVGALTLGGISSGAFNPAVSVALAWAGILSWPTAAAGIVVHLIAGAIAGVLFKALSK